MPQYLNKIVTEFISDSFFKLKLITGCYSIFFIIYEILNNNPNKVMSKIINELPMNQMPFQFFEKLQQLYNENDKLNEESILNEFKQDIINLNENVKKKMKKLLKIQITNLKSYILKYFNKFSLILNELNNDEFLNILIKEFTINFNEFYLFENILSDFNFLIFYLNDKIKNINYFFQIFELKFKITQFNSLFVNNLFKTKIFLDSILNEVGIKNNNFYEFILLFEKQFDNFQKRFDFSIVTNIYKLFYKNCKDMNDNLSLIATCHNTKFYYKNYNKNKEINYNQNGLFLLFNYYIVLNKETNIPAPPFPNNKLFEILDENDSILPQVQFEFCKVIEFTKLNKKRQFKFYLKYLNEENTILLNSNKKIFKITFNSNTKCCKAWNLIVKQREIVWNNKKLFYKIPKKLQDITIHLQE
ncbi:hypothetical protein ABK040_006202 [Willaertia magna]